MSRHLILLGGLAVVCGSPRTFAAAPKQNLWTLGTDNNRTSPFRAESYSPNAAPGSATAKDDDYYFAGTYPAPIGTLAVDEEDRNVERALTVGDPRQRFHFPLPAEATSSNARLTLTLDFFGGGAWDGQSIPGFHDHEITVRFNGVTVLSGQTLSWDTLLQIPISAADVSATTGENIIEVERSGGSDHAYIQFDYLQLDFEEDALQDSDGDGLPLWFEDLYGLDDSNGSDASGDLDGDGLDALAEFTAGSNPTDPDSDKDGLPDGNETTTDVLDPDSDGDGLLDGDETQSDPTLVDTDSDGFTDNVELEKGTDPSSGASTPFPYDGAVGIQFISDDPDSRALWHGEPAGLLRVANWNVADPMSVWYDFTTPTPQTGSMSNLVDSMGQPTPISAQWSARYADEGLHRGPSDETLLSGNLIATAWSDPDQGTGGETPASVTLSGIPHASYDIIVYVGHAYPSHLGKVWLGTDPATERFFVTNSAPPFPGFQEITAASLPEIQPGNYVRYRSLTGTTQTISVERLDSDNVGIHGIQIIDTSTDGDGDGISDSAEIEHGLDPSVHDATADADGDGLDNASELAAGSDPLDPDSDGDGLVDGDEAGHNADLLDPDSDDDGLTDGSEVHHPDAPSLPDLADSDSDTFSDPAERLAGSDPMDASSVPSPVPTWDPATRTWSWQIPDFRIRWNHSQAMVGAIDDDNTEIMKLETRLLDGSWREELSVGIRYDHGVLAHRFRCYNGIFHHPDNPDWSLSDTGSTSPGNSIQAALGFSGYGEADDSDPLRFEFTATQPTPGVNLWDVAFFLYNVSDPGNPVMLGTDSWQGAVAVGAGILDGTALWEDGDDNLGQIRFDNEPGVDVFFTRDPVGPADEDNDGMPTSWETTWSFNPNDPADAGLNADGDTLTNLEEFLIGTNPRSDDTDGDGVDDDIELARGSSPTSAASLPSGRTFPGGNPDDLDGDGLSDAWTLWSGGIPRVALADDDGDGMTNLEEEEAGTDPDDPDSKLELAGTGSGSDLLLEWTDLPFKLHVIEESTDLGSWTDASGLPAPSIGQGMRTLTLPNELTSGNTTRYFRTRIEPLDTDLDGVEDWVEEVILHSSPTEADSLAQGVMTDGGSPLSGDARALIERLGDGTGLIPGTQTTAPPSPTHAARFLMQATFGPTPDDIETVQSMGFEAWIDDQVAKPASHHQPYIRQIKADSVNGRLDPTYDYNEGSSFVTGRNVTTPWARHAIAGPDQLRQRVAFALSQILVISRRDGNLDNRPEGITNYYDMLVDHALGNFGELLLGVTMHPTMGWYLSHVGNEKADPSIPRFPDENYAREIMQLFSIGLWELNPDGTRKLDAQGQPIQTYGLDDIAELARVFTGLYYDAPYGWGGGGWADEHFAKPMVMHAAYHDFEAKQLLNGYSIPAREPSEANGLADVRDAVDSLFRHPNTAPFISKRLIQFLVTANPSPAYVGRVSAVFTDDGNGERGNLAAVVKAILMDDEARRQPSNEHYGKLKEPVVRTMHLGRLFQLATTHEDFVWWNGDSRYYDFSFQEPTYAPTVFNFFTPEYQAPGTVRDEGLVSPGFQIMDSYSSISFPNLLWRYLHDGFTADWDFFYPLDYSNSLVVADDPEALVDQLNLLICCGNMTARTRQHILTALADPGLTDHGRLAIALWTTMNSPEGAVQR